MGKVGLVVVALALLGMARLYRVDMAGALGGLPVVGAIVSPAPPPPQYASKIGSVAPASLPETDFTTWFPTDAAADPYDVTTWTAIEAYVSASKTQAGWTDVCKKVAEASGTDRAANPLLGALACSDDPTVTQLQKFAMQLVGTRGMVALWMKGASGASTGAIQARQAEMRLSCAVEVVARQGGADGPFGQACAKAFDTAYLGGDGTTTFAALGEAYTLVAAEIARRDATIDPEPGYFGTPQKKTP